ncbi:MAG TPA: hypothetical protein ENK15_04610 [Thermopetrobacter sp.]|nr:hypothetical protein [Thermopetrobacter sp.]
MRVHAQSGHRPHLSVLQSLPLLLLLWLTSTALAAGAGPFGPWQAPLLRDHPLVGRIHDTASGRAISRAGLERRLKAAPIVLLGETHDNADHHRIQAALLRAFAAAAPRPPAVVFEMIAEDRQARLDALMKLPERTADHLFDAVNWDDSGWPARALYAPLMTAALDAGGPLIAAGAPRRSLRAITEKGEDAISPARRKALKLAPLPERQQAAMEREIVKAHCDMIPNSAARRMSVIQRLRDALLAAKLVRGWRAAGRAALITGNGHVRKDRAAPLYLARHGAPRPLVVWIAEAREEAKEIADLLPDDAPPAAIADIVIVTPRAEREDPCAKFRRFMKRKKG